MNRAISFEFCLKWISFIFLDLFRIFIFKIQNHLQNHPKDKICPILAIGLLMLSAFIVERLKIKLFAIVRGCKSDFSLIFEDGWSISYS